VKAKPRLVLHRTELELNRQQASNLSQTEWPAVREDSVTPSASICYYILSKNGDLRIQVSKPKNRLHVTEVTLKVTGDFQYYRYLLTLVAASGEEIVTQSIDSREGAIKRLLKGVE
jgi:hypothetical protein